jgi:DNA-binding LytR/AlgR family response regulator
LIAVEAHDHYLKVHTDAGCELITARFVDALKDLAAAYGFRTHRSWWVAGDAIVAVRWSRGTGSATLMSGIVAPVSRAQAAALREAGW